jgi:hypothetical protein
MALYINGEKIDEKHIQAEVEKLRPDYERVFADKPADERQKQLHEWSRENVIEAVLLRQAVRKGQNIPSEAIDKVYEQFVRQNGGKSSDKEHVKKEIAERMGVEGLINRITGDLKEPSEKDVRKYYDTNADRFTMGEMVRASHIVIHHDPTVKDKQVKNQMQQILEKIRDGRSAVGRILARSQANIPVAPKMAGISDTFRVAAWSLNLKMLSSRWKWAQSVMSLRQSSATTLPRLPTRSPPRPARLKMCAKSSCRS